MNATLGSPGPSAARAMVSGEAASASVSVSRDLLMSQFWQNLQARLQPAVPKDRTGVPGQEVVQGLLFDGIDAEARGSPVGGEHHLSPLAPPDEAEASLPFPQPTETGTEIALNPAVFETVPIASGVGWIPRWGRP